MRVVHPTAEELTERKTRLLHDARLSREELERRAAAGLLTGDEYWLWDEIRSIEFLLGGTNGGRNTGTA